MGLFALITQLIGVHTVLGAFVAGILVGESPILTEEIDKQLRGIVAGLFMPVFFGLAGLTADLTVLKDSELALLTLGLILIASIGKATGAFAGGYFGGLTFRESTALAMGMNARGSTEVIVATIGLSMGMLSQNLFTMIVAMAVITTTIMPPTLRWALSRLPLRREEKLRLEREEFERTAFVPNLERTLFDYYWRGEYDDYWKAEYNDYSRYFHQHADVPGTFSSGWYDPYSIATTSHFAAMAAQNATRSA